MGQLTPFQNQVLDAAEKAEAEEQERKREEMREKQQRGGGGPTRNSRTSGGSPGGSPNNSGMGQEETVRYINKQENPDHEVHESD